MTPIAYIEHLGEVIGGGPMSLLTLVRNLDRTQYHPILVFLSDGPLPQLLSKEGFEVHILPRKHRLTDPILILKLCRLFKQRRVSLVHVNSLDIRAGLAAFICNIPLIGHLRVIFPFTGVDRLFVRMAACVISVSDAVKNHFCKNHPSLCARFTTVPNSVNIPENLPPADIRKELHLLPNARIVGAVSRIDPWKGLHTFVEMAGKLKRHPDLYFLLLGGVDQADPDAVAYNAHLQTLVADLGLATRFFFLGFRSDALGIIREMDVLAVSSRVLQTSTGLKTEGFGRVIVEAMALGVPVVATRVGGIPEIIEPGISGLLIPPDDPGAMAQSVESILTNPILSQKLSDGGRRRFQAHYHIRTHIRQIQACYQRVLSQSDPR